MAKALKIAYLGPEGTFSHMVARKRFARHKVELVPMPTIPDVFRYAKAASDRLGVVPVENTSWGAIAETIDLFVDPRRSLYIQEELSIHIRLALLGHKDSPRPKTLYSHVAPLEHCKKWLRRRLPKATLHAVASTAVAVRRAAQEKGAAALGTRAAAKLYGLDILEFPVTQDIPNLTQFLVVGKEKSTVAGSQKSSLVVTLADRPGSLLALLQPFDDEGLNLSRIVSRPIPGQANKYVFFIDIEVAGVRSETAMRRALRRARSACDSLRVVGSYPVRKPYRS